MSHWPCCGQEVTGEDVARVEKVLADCSQTTIFHRRGGCGKQLFVTSSKTAQGKVILRLRVVRPELKSLRETWTWPCCGQEIKGREKRAFGYVRQGEHHGHVDGHNCGAHFILYKLGLALHIKILDTSW